MLDIHQIMKDLAESRPIFHSEADFQFALAWQIRESTPGCEVRLEVPFQQDKSKKYLDIWLPNQGVAIELKYPTKKLNVNWANEFFKLRGHEAQDLGRYDFLKDVQRLESLVAASWRKCIAGYAILITKDLSYLNPPSGANDDSFRLWECRRLLGKMEWANPNANSLEAARKSPISLRGTYNLHWQNYSNFTEKRNGEFRYLAVAGDQT